MPDYPYVYGTAGPRPVEPGGTRIRVFRRRPRRGEEEGGEQDRDSAEDRWAAWREALADAVEELNRALEAEGVATRFLLVEEEAGLGLEVTGLPPGANLPPLPEALDPDDLPAWFARLRTRLGLLLDRRA
ncbi:hypothetical protein [Deferrisoma camini]|uniref:hypothetical protein n=1 Tax=Deferrisoma camini TaxID=1035120 RepID=UPI00046D9039|nr:hypothetical protein [Deferrisoma camini]